VVHRQGVFECAVSAGWFPYAPLRHANLLFYLFLARAFPSSLVQNIEHPLKRLAGFPPNLWYRFVPAGTRSFLFCRPFFPPLNIVQEFFRASVSLFSPVYTPSDEYAPQFDKASPSGVKNMRGAFTPSSIPDFLSGTADLAVADTLPSSLNFFPSLPPCVQGG